MSGNLLCSAGRAERWRFGLIQLARLQVGLGQQVQVFRLIGVLLNLIIQLGDIHLIARARCEFRTSVQIVEEMLVGVRTGGSIF